MLGSELVRGPIVWQDEFDYSGQPSTSKWEQLNRGNNPNAEKEFYTNGGRNAQVSGGNLVITAKKENYNGHQYTSARLHSKQYFKYGVFEMRAKLPADRGQWPAFWLLHKYPMSWPRDGEIGNLFSCVSCLLLDFESLNSHQYRHYGKRWF